MKNLKPIAVVSLMLLFIMAYISIDLLLVTDNNTPNINNFQCYYKLGDSPMGEGDSPAWANFDTTEWKPLIIPGKPEEVGEDNFIWLKIHLKDEVKRDPSLLFMTYDQVFQVYLDGKIIYSYGSFESDKIKRTIGSPTHVINLPEDYYGKPVFIRMYSLRKTNIGLVRKLSVDTRSNHIIKIAKSSFVTTLLAILFIFIGFCSFIISFVKGQEIKILRSLALSSIVTGIWLFSDSESKQLFFTNHTLWKYVTAVTFYSLPACYYNLIKHFLHTRFSRILAIQGLSHLAFMLIAISLDLLGILSVINTQEIFFLMFGVNLAICFWVLYRSYIEWNTETRILVGGFSILCLLAVFDLLNWNLNTNHSSHYITQWGVLVFLFSLTAILVYKFLSTKHKAETYSKQLMEAMINDQLKTEFFANVSHELRTPLNILLSTLQLLSIYVEDGSIRSEKRNLKNYFDIMKQNCYRLIRLVGNIIDMTKIDSGYLKPEMTNGNIIQVIEDITQSAAEYIKAKNLEVIFDTEVEEKVMACDPEKVERIILNLLSNAVKFTKPGGKIYVNIFDNIDSIKIQVKDTGLGIKKEKLSVIFDRFVQVDKSLSRNHEGSGIGLSLVKSLVEMQGGTISVESEYGKGTVFTIIFPTVIVPENQTQNSNEMNIVHDEKVCIEFSDMGNL